MKKNRKRTKMMLVLGIVALISTNFKPVYAQNISSIEFDTLDEAKEYLKSYEEEGINKYGKTYTIEYEFSSEEDLELAAEYLLENGLDNFEMVLDNKVQEVVAEEEQNSANSISTRAANPLSATITIERINKTHKVDHDIFGRVDFDKLGSAEYILNLYYEVTVSGGKITKVDGEKLRTVHFSGSTSLGESTIPTGFSDTGASATANYYIVKSIAADIGGFEVTLRTEQKQDWFCLLTYLKN